MKWLYGSALAFALTTLASSQQRPISQRYITDVLSARVVAVVPYSQSEPVDDPQENERARRDTEQALMQWGKYQVSGDASHADLIFVVRKGRTHSTTVDNGPTPGVVLYPNPNDSGITIGTHRGQTAPLSRNDPQPGQNRRHVGQEVGSAEDMLEVYLGGNPRVDDATRSKTSYPLDEPPIWTYTADDALKPPSMDAVTKFRKAIEAAQKKQH